MTGWTLPYQMGVEAHAVTTPLVRAVPRFAAAGAKTPAVSPRRSTRDANASFRAINEILAANGKVMVRRATKSPHRTSIRRKLDAILTENHCAPAPSKEEASR